LAFLALLAGAALGTANLAANWLIATGDPAIRKVLVERMTTMQPVDALVVSPLIEEVAVRWFFMSAMAWLVFRFSRRATLAFVVALIGSSLVFAVMHLARPFPGDPALDAYYRTTLLMKYTLSGLPLGWIFWRWGLPYAILCHIAANAAHLALQGLVFRS
jgi:membrane protease YdiL (CAAX protease family)